MKVLVATPATQGAEPGDYNWSVDGELVSALTVDCSSPDCGCQRGFSGLGSSGASTTAMVVELEHMDRLALRTAIHDSLQREGWLAGLSKRQRLRLVERHFTAIRLVSELCPTQTVIRRSGTRIWTYEEAA
jgi:hypothetical protein